MCIGSRATMYTDLAGSSTMALVLPLSPRHLRDHALQTVQLVEGTSAYPTTLIHTSGTGPRPHDIPGCIEPLCSGGYACIAGCSVVHMTIASMLACVPSDMALSVWWW